LDFAIDPHGGTLINRELDAKELEQIWSKLDELPKIKLNAREQSDIEMIAVGAFSPLTGFMTREEYESVIDNMRLLNGLPWTIPITLSTSDDNASELSIGQDIALIGQSGRAVAILNLEEKYHYDKEKEALQVYGTDEVEHPGVAYLKECGDVLLGGEIFLIEREHKDDFKEYRLDPIESRQLFKDKGWKRIVGFQTRNPVHRAHEYIQKCALETVEGLFLHPLVGETKSGDIPADVRMECYKVLLDKYYPKDRVILGVLPAAMRYAGPKEAIFHAIIRKNYGCTHFIVGRDHAGVGGYYGSFDAHFIFDEFDPQDLDITPLFFDYTFYCKSCGGMASYKTCPHDSEEHIALSGTKVREMLKNGELPPSEFSRPEVASLLIESMKEG